jgi:hypothetical protein
LPSESVEVSKLLPFTEMLTSTKELEVLDTDPIMVRPSGDVGELGLRDGRIGGSEEPVPPPPQLDNMTPRHITKIHFDSDPNFSMCK